MERLTNDAINNLLAMSKYDYHMYGLDIKTALSELKECRATGLTPDEINTIAKSQIATAGHNVELQEEIAELKAANERLREERDYLVENMNQSCENCTRRDEKKSCELHQFCCWQWRGIGEQP